MSRGYSTALSLSGKARPAHANKQVWGRYQKIASDPRFSQIDPSALPDSYVSLYEMSRMPDDLFEAVTRSGILGPKTSVRLLRKVRVTGKVPVRVEMWVAPGQVRDLERRLAELEASR